MKFLPSNPAKAAEKKLAETVTSRDALAARLVVAQGAVAECTTALQRLAVQGADDAELAAGEAKLRDAERRVSTLAPALAEIETLLAKLEAEQAEMLDKKLRTQTAAATNALADEYLEIAAAYDASTAALGEVAERALAVSMEANGTHIFAQSSRIEVAAATVVVVECLRQHGRAFTNGLAKAEMPKPAPPPAKPVPAPPKAPTVRVFSNRPIKWRDSDGKQVSAGKCVDIDLPVAVAERGLASGACVKLDHPTRIGNIGMWPGNYSLAACFDLDAPGTTVEPIVHSQFQPLPGLREPFKLKIAGGAS